MKNSKRVRYINIAAILFFVFVGVLFYGQQTKASEKEKKEKVVVEYYFYNSCDGCTEGEYFGHSLQEKVKDVIGHEDYEFILKDVSKQEVYEEFEKITEDKKTQDFYPQPPLLKIGDTYLFGMDEITEKSRDIMIREIEEKDRKQDELLQKMKGIDSKDTFFVYFYVPGCTDCEKVQKYLEAMDKEIYQEAGTVSQVKIVYVNIGDFENVPLANWFFEHYQVQEQDRKAPALFYQNGYLQGFEEIKNRLPQIVKGTEARNWQDITYTPEKGKSQLNIGDWGMLLFTGLVNGLNPCGLSLILLLLSLLIAKKEKIWKLGMAYIAAKLITYLLLGTVFSSVVGQLGQFIEPAQNVLKVILAFIFLIFALLNFMDVVTAKKEKYGKIKLQLPQKLKKFNNAYLEKMLDRRSGSLTIMVFIAGVVVSAGEFLCTGQLYLASILYVMEKSGAFNWSVFLMFGVYLICMCIPLLVITVLADRSAKLFSISEMVRKKMPVIKLLYGLLFIVFAVLIFVL